jgi:hypothetical protein
MLQVLTFQDLQTLYNTVKLLNLSDLNLSGVNIASFGFTNFKTLNLSCTDGLTAE